MREQAEIVFTVFRFMASSRINSLLT